MSGEGEDHKYKGLRGPSPRSGLGRLRKAAESTPGRVKDWERHAEDDHFLDQEAPTRGHATHLGENLLARFNRVARSTASVPKGCIPARVCGFAGRQIIVRLPSGEELTCEVRQALLKRFSGVRNPLVVGDHVHVQRDDAIPNIVAVDARMNLLARADSHNRALLHQLAANVDCLVVVSALLQPDFKPGFLDRYLLLAAANDIPACIALNKSDLADPTAAVACYQAIGYPTFATCAEDPNHPGVIALRALLHGRTAVVAGQSGVGKSSLLNALHPGLGLRVGEVSDDTGKGRHTTSSARSIPLPGGGEIIDTPGIRECGITGLTTTDVALLFPDIAKYHQHCRFNDCTHRHEPDCAVLAAVKAGTIAAHRYASYCSIITEDLA